MENEESVNSSHAVENAAQNSIFKPVFRRLLPKNVDALTLGICHRGGFGGLREALRTLPASTNAGRADRVFEHQLLETTASKDY